MPRCPGHGVGGWGRGGGAVGGLELWVLGVCSETTLSASFKGSNHPVAKLGAFYLPNNSRDPVGELPRNERRSSGASSLSAES